MKKLFIALVVLAACSSPKTQETVSETAITKFGADITEDGSIALASLTEAMTSDSMAVKVEGKIIEVCQMKGCWMKLDMGNDQTMTVRFKDYGFFVPKDAAGKIAVIDGFVKKSVTSVETLKHYAEDGGKTQEEIDAITEPKEGYNFEASGVILKDASK